MKLYVESVFLLIRSWGYILEPQNLQAGNAAWRDESEVLSQKKQIPSTIPGDVGFAHWRNKHT